MSRFGSTATFYYAPGDTFASGTYLYLNSQNMPNYPFETFEDTDKTMHRTKTGRKYIFQNYSKQGYVFNFSNLSEASRGSLRMMYDALPIFTFNTNNTTWGTFRFSEESWQDEEVAFELYDLSFSIVGDA
jgi:hypothetical protein